MSGRVVVLSVAVLSSFLTACASVEKSAAPSTRNTHALRPPGRGERLQRAIAGLRFDSGFVEITDHAARDAGNTDAATLCKNGRALLNQNQRTAAAELFARALTRDENSVEAYLGLGVALRRLGKLDRAIAAFRSAVRSVEDDITPRVQLADTLAMRGSRKDAVAEWLAVLRQDPTQPNAHAKLAILYYYEHDYANAWKHTHAAEASKHAVPPQFLVLLRSKTADRTGFTQGSGNHNDGGQEHVATPTIGPQIRIDANGATFAANETTISAAGRDGLEIVAGWNDLRAETDWRLGVGVSLDGGATWDDFILRPPPDHQTEKEGDPMTAFDPRTGNLWVGAIAFLEQGGGVFVARKRPGESEFDPAVMADVTSGADKGWMAAGPGVDAPDATSLYIAYNRGLLRSADLGATWAGPTPLGAGIGFLPRVGPGGEVYVSDGFNMVLYRSLDGGASFEPPFEIAQTMDGWGLTGNRYPGRFRVPRFAAIAVDPNTGHLFCVYADTTDVVDGESLVDLYITKSVDRGSTWTTPTIVSQYGASTGDQFWPWLEIDDESRLHLLYFDTRNTKQLDNQIDGWIDAYYAFSEDAGQQWHEFRLTPTPFNSRDDGLPNQQGNNQFLGDYLGLAVAGSSVYPCYPDTRNGDPDIQVHRITFPGGDFDGDGDTDLADYDAFAACVSGAGESPGFVPPLPDCRVFDDNDDGDVDLIDFGALQEAFNGDCGVSIVQDPLSVTVCPGAFVSFDVQADGDDVTFQWHRDGIDIPGAANAALDLDPATSDSAGLYHVTVRAQCGAVNSLPAVLQVYDLQWTLHPIDVAACENGIAQFSAAAAGAAPLAYQWQFNGTDIPSATGVTLVVDPVTDLSAGSYRCVVTDGCDAVIESAPATLTLVRTSIETQPASGTFCTGQAVFLFVIADAGVTFQWFKDGDPIDGATRPFHVIANASPDDSGAYHAEVTGQCDAVASDAAIVIVEPCDP